MDVKLNANPGIRPGYYRKQPCAPKAKTSSSPIGRKNDSVEISPEGRELHSRIRMLKELEDRCGVRGGILSADRPGSESGGFPSFLDEFDRLLASDGSFSNMAALDMQANQNVRHQLERSLQTLFSKAGIELPEDASFRLTVSPSDYCIRVNGMDDPELARSIEIAVNTDGNGRKLYNHIQYCNPARFGCEEPAQYITGRSLGLDYTGGRLSDLGTQYGYGPEQTGWQAHLRAEPEKAALRYMEQAKKIAQDLDAE